MSIRLTDTDTSPCTLDGYPTSFTGVRSDGSQQQLTAHHGTFFDGSGYWPANLQSGQSASLTIGTADGCQALNQPTPTPDPFAGEIVGLPGGGTITAEAAFDPSCGLDVSELGVPAPPPPDPDAYPGLTLAVDAPATASHGSTLHFTITLTNISNHQVDLDPCPVYSQGLYTAHTGGESATYLLNCDKVHSIAAEQSVTYAMQMSVPNTTGFAKIGWSIPSASLGWGNALEIT